MRVRPALKPALRPVWRDEHTMQLGTDPDRTVLIGGLDPARARLVQLLDGTRDLAALHREADRLGLGRDDTDELLDLLLSSGAYEDASADPAPLRRLPLPERDRLAPDLAALSVAHQATDGGLAILARRQRAVVTVQGAGRVGAPLAALLGAAGVGHVAVRDAGDVRPRDLSPAGHRPGALGENRAAAAAAAVRAVAPSTRTEPVPERARPDVVVVTGEGGTDPVTLFQLVRDGVAHLLVELREASAVVGPLVLPGGSSCRRCHDLHRSERDPAWPRVAAQLAVTRAVTAACDVALASMVAATAALQVLAHLDGGPRPPAVDGTLEISLPGGLIRRRSWSPHPACGCGWAQPG